MIDGIVEITPKNDGRINPILLLKATYDSGVSVAEMSIIARGQIKKAPDGLVLQVQPSQSFSILQNEVSKQLETLAGSNNFITVKGLLFQKQKGQKKPKLPASLNITIVEIQQNSN